MRITIDRFEGDFAVVLTESGKSVNVPKILLDGGREGDVYDITRNDGETKERSERIQKLADELWK